MSEWPDHLDEALDNALTTYGKTPENAGLEQRILVRLTQRTTRARRMRVLTAAMGTAAVAAGAMFWWVTPRVAVPTQPASTRALVSNRPESLQQDKVALRNAEGVLARAKNPRTSRNQRAQPKLPQFPTPSPVGSQERALLQLAKFKAEHTTQELSYLDTPVTPIQIVAVEIKPIE